MKKLISLWYQLVNWYYVKFNKRKTKLQILDEIAQTYTLKTRSTVASADVVRCVYRGPNGRKCAFAMLCKDNVKLPEGKSASDLIERFGQGILKPQYAGHEPDFYDACQQLHDNPANWDNKGLSTHGTYTLNKLKKIYKE